MSFSFQAPVVQKLDQLSSEKKSLSSGSVLGKPIALSGSFVRRVNSTIHWVNYYPKDSAIGFLTTFPLDSDLSGG